MPGSWRHRDPRAKRGKKLFRGSTTTGLRLPIGEHEVFCLQIIDGLLGSHDDLTTTIFDTDKRIAPIGSVDRYTLRHEGLIQEINGVLFLTAKAKAILAQVKLLES